jgi:hypothetical protein
MPSCGDRIHDHILFLQPADADSEGGEFSIEAGKEIDGGLLVDFKIPVGPHLPAAVKDDGNLLGHHSIPFQCPVWLDLSDNSEIIWLLAIRIDAGLAKAKSRGCNAASGHKGQNQWMELTNQDTCSFLRR